MSLVVRKNAKAQHQRGRQLARVVQPSMVTIRPPPYLANPYSHRKYRYTCATAGGYNITPKMVGQSLGMMCTASNSASSLHTAFRLTKITVWGPGLSTVSITWFGDQNLNFESNREISDTSTSDAFTPYISCRPPKGSSASFWQAVGSNWSGDVFFTIHVAVGSVIDVEVDVVTADGPASPTSSVAISGGSAGEVRYPSLDGYGGGFLPATSKTAL